MIVRVELCYHFYILSHYSQVREEIEFENLAKMYLREMIKKECWDEMVVKGRAVQVKLINIFLSSSTDKTTLSNDSKWS